MWLPKFLLRFCFKIVNIFPVIGFDSIQSKNHNFIRTNIIWCLAFVKHFLVWVTAVHWLPDGNKNSPLQRNFHIDYIMCLQLCLSLSLISSFRFGFLVVDLLILMFVLFLDAIDPDSHSFIRLRMECTIPTYSNRIESTQMASKCFESITYTVAMIWVFHLHQQLDCDRQF